jgi:hypothetical protein
MCVALCFHCRQDKYLSQGRNADGSWPQDEPATPEAPQQKAHKLQGHRSIKNLWGLGGSCKQSAGTVKITVLAGA